MKKCDYYRPSASSLGKKRKIRKKVSFSFLRQIVFFLVFAGLCAAAYVGISRAYRAISASRLGNWQPQEIVVSGVDGSLAKELLSSCQDKTKSAFSVSDSVQLQADLVRQYPQLRRIEIRRGLLSGKLKISVKRRVPVAKFAVTDTTTQFIDEDGFVYADASPDPTRNVPSVELEGATPEKLDAEFVDLLQSTLKLKNQLNFVRLRFNTKADTVKMYLPEGRVLNFGSVKNLRQKARRAAQIGALTKDIHYPYELDFTYFNDGKVFLRQTGY